jgi:multidrug resistance protein, MATE family
MRRLRGQVAISVARPHARRCFPLQRSVRRPYTARRAAPTPRMSSFDYRRLRREMRLSLALALPLVLGQLSSIAMNVVDTLIAGRHSAQALAAVAVGSAVWSLVILVLIGVLMAVPPSVSQLNGAGRRGEIGPLFRQALWLALAWGSPVLLVRQSGPLLAAMGVDPDVRPGAEAFLDGISWGAPALGLYFAFRYLSEGVA